MKNVIKLLGIIVFVAVFGFSFTACSNGSTKIDPPQTVMYSGITAAKELYTLKITENTNRAIYAPQDGDWYELIFLNSSSTKKSSGTVSVISGNILTLTPSNSATSFTATTVTGGGLTMSGTITWTDNSTSSPPAITPAAGTIPADFQGTWKGKIETLNLTLTFTANSLKWDEGGGKTVTWIIDSATPKTNTDSSTNGTYPSGYDLDGIIIAYTGHPFLETDVPGFCVGCYMPTVLDGAYFNSGKTRFMINGNTGYLQKQ